MAKKRKPIYPCGKCDAGFYQWPAYRRHQRQKHFEEFVTYFSLTDNPSQWGHSYATKEDARDFKKSPYDNALKFSILLHIWEELRQIRKELPKK